MSFLEEQNSLQLNNSSQQENNPNSIQQDNLTPSGGGKTSHEMQQPKFDFTCQICCQSYSTTGLLRPHSLPCGHTLCGVCATKILVNGELICPVCKQSYKYQDLNKIAINHELEKVIENLTSVSPSKESTVTNQGAVNGDQNSYTECQTFASSPTLSEFTYPVNINGCLENNTERQASTTESTISANTHMETIGDFMKNLIQMPDKGQTMAFAKNFPTYVHEGASNGDIPKEEDEGSLYPTIQMQIESYAGLVSKESPLVTGPKLHYGVCEEHGNYKVHHCQTHNSNICSDCAVAYHFNCQRIPLKELFSEKKADFCERIDSRLTLLQEVGNQMDNFRDVCKDIEFHHKSEIENLQARIKEHEKQIKDCQMSDSRYSALKNEFEDCTKQDQISKDVIQNAATFKELDYEIKHKKSSESTTNQVKVRVRQSLGELLTSDAFVSLVKHRETYAPCTHKNQKRWIRINFSDNELFMQDFGITEPPAEALIIRSLCDMTRSKETCWFRNVSGDIRHPYRKRHRKLSDVTCNWHSPAMSNLKSSIKMDSENVLGQLNGNVGMYFSSSVIT